MTRYNDKRMKIALLLILASFFVTVISCHPLSRDLGQRYPELASGTFSGYLKQGEQTYMLPEAMENQQISEILQDCCVKAGYKTKEEPKTAFCLRFSGDASLSIVVGQDGEIYLAETDDLERTRRFWKDDGSLFEALYAYYLQSGGATLPDA